VYPNKGWDLPDLNTVFNTVDVLLFKMRRARNYLLAGKWVQLTMPPDRSLAYTSSVVPPAGWRLGCSPHASVGLAILQAVTYVVGLNSVTVHSPVSLLGAHLHLLFSLLTGSSSPGAISDQVSHSHSRTQMSGLRRPASSTINKLSSLNQKHTGDDRGQSACFEWHPLRLLTVMV
jgi:hypothetical protein